MGGCCSKDVENVVIGDHNDNVPTKKEVEEEDDIGYGDDGARVRRLQGFSRYISMFTQQGRKGINQDAMTVWEDFTGEKGATFCGVFDGHGPFGHKVAHHVRDVLPSKLSSAIKLSRPNGYNHSDVDDDDDDDEDNDGSSSTTKDSHDIDHIQNLLLSSWNTSFIDAYREMDEQLSGDWGTDCFCSGTTAVNVVKQGDYLIIANLGDSRAILGTRDNNNQLVPAELTVDLKPNLPNEAERIINCKGRVYAMPEEPDVYRLWLPEDDSPGLAMSRAFGDFCLKKCGLISIPVVSHRKLTDKDEFVVLATDGVWDVLTNNEVITIVASARKRSMSAKLLVEHAVREWRNKYPGCKVDDCAVICLFLKHHPPSLNKSKPAVTQYNANDVELAVSQSSRSTTRREGGAESINGKNSVDSKEEWSALEGISRVNSLLKISRFSNVPRQNRKKMMNKVVFKLC